MKKMDNKKGQLSLIAGQLLFMIGFAVSSYLNFNFEMWKEVQFKIKDGSVMEDILKPVIGLLEHLFSASGNIYFVLLFGLVLSLTLTVLLFVFCGKRSIAHYLSFVSWCFGVAALLSFVIYVILFSSATPTLIYFYHTALGIMLMLLLPFVVVMVKTCFKCYCFNTKVCTGQEEATSYYQKHVDGGYKTVRGDLRDRSGNVIGKVETKAYVEGYDYTTSSTTKTKTYVCIKCGDVTERTSSS